MKVVSQPLQSTWIQFVAFLAFVVYSRRFHSTAISFLLLLSIDVVAVANRFPLFVLWPVDIHYSVAWMISDGGHTSVLHIIEGRAPYLLSGKPPFCFFPLFYLGYLWLLCCCCCPLLSCSDRCRHVDDLVICRLKSSTFRPSSSSLFIFIFPFFPSPLVHGCRLSFPF